MRNFENMRILWYFLFFCQLQWRTYFRRAEEKLINFYFQISSLLQLFVYDVTYVLMGKQVYLRKEFVIDHICYLYQ